MRVNVYAEEMTDLVEVIEKETNGGKFTGLRLYLQLPVTTQKTVQDPEALKEGGLSVKETLVQTRGPFVHGPGDDDSSAVTFWGKQDLRRIFTVALKKLTEHYGEKHNSESMWENQADHAWLKVFETLIAYNPVCFTGAYRSSAGMAVDEIKRLQRLEGELKQAKELLTYLRFLIGTVYHTHQGDDVAECTACEKPKDNCVHTDRNLLLSKKPYAVFDVSSVPDSSVPVSTTSRYKQDQGDAEVLRILLNRALGRMTEARKILTDGNPRPGCNWGLLDVFDIEKEIP